MSELLNTQNTERDFRWQLLTTVSALALIASVNMRDAHAADQNEDRPTVWIELGGDLVHVSGQGEPFSVGFLTTYPNSPVLQKVTPLQAQNPSPFGFAEEGKISFQPESSDWVFSLSVNYGRSNNFTHVDHQTNETHQAFQSGVPTRVHPFGTNDFADTQVHHRESHTILDFSVGKDVGLGMFGRGGSSILNLGVRFAQFTSSEIFDARARPDLQWKYFTKYNHKTPFPYFHTYHVAGQASRNFHGLGPSLSWNASTPFAGNPQNGEITFDWGGSVALLFGKQKTTVQHHETGNYLPALAKIGEASYTVVYQHSGGHSNIKTVMVPNLGGFAGASVRYSDVKLSFGYRADFFFGAMDTGIDAAKRTTTGFYGPFVSIGLGLGG